MSIVPVANPTRDAAAAVEGRTLSPLEAESVARTPDGVIRTPRTIGTAFAVVCIPASEK